jgi:hypothetical protein
MRKRTSKNVDRERQMKNLVGNAAFFVVAIAVLGTFYVSDLKHLVVAASNVAATVSALMTGDK